MRIACVQFDCKLADFDGNVATVERLLDARGIERGGIDLLVLPEMAFAGYSFRDRAEIEPFAENAASGPTVSWANAAAQRLHCAVACGFVERGDGGSLHNAMAVVGRGGDLIHVHRKHFLYKTDETWATEGPGFACRPIPGIGEAAFAICMDLNPKGFVAPFDAYEFASSAFDPPLLRAEKPTSRHCLRANLVIACNAWIRLAEDQALPEPERSFRLMNYWAARLAPLLDRPVILALANRIGTERGTTFAGTSCVIDLKRRQILGHLAAEEGILVVDTNS